MATTSTSNKFITSTHTTTRTATSTTIRTATSTTIRTATRDTTDTTITRRETTNKTIYTGNINKQWMDSHIYDVKTNQRVYSE